MARPTKEQIEERERLAESGLKRCAGSGCGEVKSVNEFSSHKGKWDGKCILCISCSRNHSKKYNQNNKEARREYNAKKLQEDPLHYRLKSGRLRAKNAGAEWEDISSTELLSHWKQNNISIDICHYCKQTIDEGELEIEHGTPISRGGGHRLDNLFPSHKKCNISKRDRNVEEYLNYIKRIETCDNSWYQSLTDSQRSAVDAARYKRKKGQKIGSALRHRLSRVPELV